MAFWPRPSSKSHDPATEDAEWQSPGKPGQVIQRKTLGEARHMRTVGAVLWGILTPVLALPAAAQEPSPSGLIHELKIGAQVHDVPYMWSGFNKEPYNVDLNVEVLFGPSVKLWSGSIRAALGTTINFDGYTSKAYLDARWQWDCTNNMFYAVGLGIAVHNGETFTLDPEFKQLGRRVLFHPHAEIGYRINERHSVSLFFEHISNASTAAKNEGLDTLGIRLGHRF
jgi:lipid A 3-O-deacylase